jgi:PAS domain S-box-containing protein
MEGGGEAGALLRSIDWARTPLGPVEAWPWSLKTTIGTVLHSRHPMFLWWGPELIQVYNDAYTPSFGHGKHPAAMGQRGRDCWDEIWPIIGPQIEDVRARGLPSWHEDHLVPIFRNGHIEEVYWTYGYSPVFVEDGTVGGVLVVCTETTARVVAARRLRASHVVAEQTGVATERAGVLPLAMEALGSDPGDVPYALAYRWDRGGTRARRVTSLGLEGQALARVEAEALEAVEALRIEGGTSAGPFALPGAPSPAYAVATVAAAEPGGREVVLFGLNPALPFDADYRDFLLHVVEHVGLAGRRIEGIRARAAAEAERNNLLTKAPMATALMVGPEHVFELANPLYCQLVGRRPEELLGRSYREAIPEVEDGPLPEILDRVYRTGERFVSEETLVPLDRDGDGRPEDCYFKFNLEPIRDADGRVYGMMAVAIDLTEQVTARRVLERASRAKDEFLAMLGHELRNPLGAIAAAVRVLDAREIGPRSRALGVLLRQVATITRLLDDLLDVARISRGRIELRPERIDLRVVAQRAVEVAGPMIEARRHALAVALPPEALHVEADPTRVEQVLVNLLTNAAKYTPPGGRVALSLSREGGVALARVTDTGAGIAADVLPHIFDLFVQAERTLDRADGGVGLGLTLVRGLVELHRGTVSAHSPGLGGGSEFVVRLPLAAGVSVR